MDVFRFAAIEAVKKEAIRAGEFFDGWHLFLILRSSQPGNLFRWAKKTAHSWLPILCIVIHLSFEASSQFNNQKSIIVHFLAPNEF